MTTNFRAINFLCVVTLRSCNNFATDRARQKAASSSKMVGSSLASLLAHSWVSLDFDLASVSCQELNGKQQLDEKTVVEVLLFKARSLLGRYVVLKKLSINTWIIYLDGPQYTLGTMPT